MIFDIMKKRKHLLVVAVVAGGLFLLAYLFLKETIPYAIAVALLPFPLFRLYEKLRVLVEKEASFKKDSHGYSQGFLQFLVMNGIFAFCAFEFSDHSKAVTICVCIAYALADRILSRCRNRSEKNERARR